MAADRLLHALPRDPFVNVDVENSVYSCLSHVGGLGDLLGSLVEVSKRLPLLRIAVEPLPRRIARRMVVGEAGQIA